MKITGYIFLGTAIKGDWSRPVPLRSLEEFRNQFGTYGPEGSMTYEYVGGILSAGLPVLFQRIACQGQAGIEWSHNIPNVANDVPRAQCAKYSITHNKGTDPNVTTVVDCIVSEKWGGTYGNKIKVNIKMTNNTIYVTVKYGATTIEKAQLITLTGTEDEYDRKLAVINAINTVELETINLNAPIEIDPETGEYKREAVLEFQIPLTGSTIIDGKEVDNFVELANGTDFDEALVPAEIPALIYPKLTDKILYLPKFITSGGYTDSLDDDQPASRAIGEAMKQLTEARQDCRALIDLPLGTKLENQQKFATKYAYSQIAGNSIIPSASICAPWVYMQIGANTMWTPPSFAYLTLVGGSVSTGGKAYTPKAGLATGRVMGVIKPEFEIGSDIAEEWQRDGVTNINPIMRLQSGNYVIAGNSTLLVIGEDEVNAFNESSADLAVIEIRRFVYNLGMELQYQYNSQTAFENFSMRTSKFLDRMASDGTVTDYAIVNVSTNDDPRTLKIKLNVWVAPTIKAIEIYLNVAYGNVTLSEGGEA